MILASQEGELRFRIPGETDWHRAVVGLGIVQVANNRVTVVVDTAERPEDIDQVRARQALERKKHVIVLKNSSVRSRASGSTICPGPPWREP